MWNQAFIILSIFHVNSIRAGNEIYTWPYYHDIQGWLKLYTEPSDYQDAKLRCHLHDGLLAAGWNSEFTKAIVGLMSSLRTEDQSEPAVYSGSEAVYTRNGGEPVLIVGNNTVEERCEVIYRNGTTGEVDCRQRHPFVCYAHSPACGQDPLSGYMLLTKGGHCYKYYSNNTNWTEAYEAFRKDGAYLAVVNSAAEAHEIEQIIPVNVGNNFALIGLYFWKPAMSWRTVKGQTLQQAGFSEWRSGEPKRDSYRGVLISGGELGSVPDDKKGPFICEMDPILALKFSNAD